MRQRELKVLILGGVPEIDGIFERPMFTEELPAAGIWVSDDEDFVPALEAADNYDLIVVDLAPYGLEVIEEVRKYRPTSPVLAVASVDEVDLVLDAKRLGLEDYAIRTRQPATTADLLAEKIYTQLERFVEPPEMDKPSADLMYRYAHFYNVAEPFFVVSLRRHLIYVNQAGRQLVERLHDRMPTVGDEVDVWHLEPTLEECQTHFDRAFEGHQIVTRREVPSEDGVDLYELAYQPVVDPTGRIIAVSITVHQPGRPQLQRARTAQEVTTFAGGVAHRLNNLLNVLTANAELLNDQHDEKAEPVERLLRGAEHAAQFIHKMQAYSRIAVTDREQLSIDDVVGDIEDKLRSSIGQQVDLQFELDGDLPTLRADRDQLKMVVGELVANASEASESGGVVWVRTGRRRIRGGDPDAEVAEGDYVVLEVEDQGEGIPEEGRDQILEPFVSTRSADEHAGLGLSIVRTVAEQAGGGVAVESTPGEGTSVRVYFPVWRGSTDSEPLREADEGQARAEDVTVLLIEDELTLQQSYRDILELDDYQILTASTAEEARAVVRNDGDRIDLIVSDIVLPDGRGTDLAGDLLEEIGEIPVLFVSGYTEAPDEIGCVGDAPSAFLAKPFGVDTLLETVGKLSAT